MLLALVGYLYRRFVDLFTGTPSHYQRAVNAFDRFMELEER